MYNHLKIRTTRNYYIINSHINRENAMLIIG